MELVRVNCIACPDDYAEIGVEGGSAYLEVREDGDKAVVVLDRDGLRELANALDVARSELAGMTSAGAEHIADDFFDEAEPAPPAERIAQQVDIEPDSLPAGSVIINVAGDLYL